MLECKVSNLKILLILSSIKAAAGSDLRSKEIAFKSRFWERSPHFNNANLYDLSIFLHFCVNLFQDKTFNHLKQI